MEAQHLASCIHLLRMTGYLELAEWNASSGQGYKLTEAGHRLLADPAQMAMLRQGIVPRAVESRPSSPVHDPIRIARAEAARAAWEHPAFPVVTATIILVNVCWFLYGAWIAHQDGAAGDLWLGTTEKVFRLSGGVVGSDISRRHEWWRLLTCCFVHIGFIHLAVNMYSLYAVGPVLERLWGSGRFLVLYLLAGLCSSCIMLIGNPVGGGAGASGALFGLIGSLASWLFLNRRILHPVVVRSWSRQLVFTLLLNLYITFGISGVSEHISKGAHLGGLAAGVVLAVPLDALRFSKRYRALSILCLVLVPLACLAGVASVERQAPMRSARTPEEQKELISQLEGAISATLAFVENRALPVVDMDPPHRRAGSSSAVRARLARIRQELILASRNLSTSDSSAPLDVSTARLRDAIGTVEEMLDLMIRRLDAREVWTNEDDAFVEARLNALHRMFP
jgi:membrane associated rhomboid family serine protease